MNIEVIKGKAIGFDQMKTPADERLKQALAKMLPEKVEWVNRQNNIWWKDSRGCFISCVLDTELLHLCAFAEKTLGNAQCPTQSHWCQYIIALQEICGEVPSLFATWQQRVTALAKIKNIEL